MKDTQNATVTSLWSSWWASSAGRTSPWTGFTHAWSQRVGKASRPTGTVVVFTDPDGTLLEHRTHHGVPHCEALRLLADRAIPLVLCSSRTRAELEVIQQAFDFRHPFISENGGAVYLPRGYFSSLPHPREMSGYEVIAFGGAHHDVVEVLRRTAESVGVAVRSLNGMSVQEVAEECSLSPAEARLAQLREYSEPFRILTSDASAQSRLLNGLRRAGLRCVNGGRLHHVSFGADARRAVRTLTSLYRQWSGDVLTVGVSAGLTDPSFLHEVDIPIVVLNPEVDAVRVLRKVPKARLTSTAGSLGWDEAILSVVEPELQNATGRR